LPTVTAEWLQAYARGLNHMAQSCGVALVGGDTTRGPLSLTMTVFGRVPAGQALTRGGAQPGDLLCVGGELGNAAGALPLVLGQRDADTRLPSRCWRTTGRRNRSSAWVRRCAAKPLRRWISPTVLLADCGHIALASKVRLEVERERVPLSEALVAFLGQRGAECSVERRR
jgi:thiamine-monophosphate kinase